MERASPVHLWGSQVEPFLTRHRYLFLRSLELRSNKLWERHLDSLRLLGMHGHVE